MTLLLRSLKARREALVVRSGLQRKEIGKALAPAQRMVAAGDRAVAALRAHPVIAAAAAAALALIGPGRWLRWALRAVPIYSFLRR